jgi:SIR2-like domain
MLDLAGLLGADNLDAFMRGMARRKYHVLLGAGASLGGRSAGGRPLPGGADVADELQTLFDIPVGGASNLRRLYSAARRRSAADGSGLSDYIRGRFTKTTPPGWLNAFVQVGWQQVWTLNVDDCLSRAYELHDDVAQQRLVSVSWTDRHRTARESESQLLAVHLHGKASRANREDELVFDISSYIEATAAQHRWHRLFGDAYRAQPFLIVGASLDAEIDLQAVLDQGQVAMEHPSLIVLRDIDELQEEEYRGYGLLPVRATADAFFEAVLALLPTHLAELTGREAADVAEVPAEAMRFLHQWKELSLSDGPAHDRRHDVFKGHEPLWTDAVGERLSTRSVVNNVVSLADSSVTDPARLLHVMAGPSFSGKTAAMFGAARRFIREGYKVFQLDSPTAPDVEALYWWIQRYPKTILVVDNAADFVKDIAAVYALAAGGPVVPRILAVERAHRLNHINNVLVLTPRVDHSVAPTITNTEIKSLIGVLKKNNRLGDLTGKGEREQFDYFVKDHQREMFSAMANLERGREFQTRVLDEYDSIHHDVSLRLLGVAALTAHLGYGVPFEIVQSSAGISSRELNAALEAELGDLLVASDGSVHLRHRYMGQVLIEYRLTVSEKLEIALRLGASVAPHVSIASISASTIHYRIARALMGHDILADLLKNDSDAVLDWYEKLQPEFDWNARFWEQRALAAADALMFEPAFSWAREAVDRRRDSLTLNTVGAVLMRRAVDEARRGRWPAETYELAELALREARMFKDANEYPYDTFLVYTLRLVQRVVDLDTSTRSFLITTWNEWYVSILARDEATRARLHERLGAANTQWSRLMGLED